MVAYSRPLAALAATVLAAAAGVWATLLAGTVVLAGSALALWLSPIRLLTHLPESSFPREEGGPVLQPPHGPAANRRSFSP